MALLGVTGQDVKEKQTKYGLRQRASGKGKGTHQHRHAQAAIHPLIIDIALPGLRPDRQRPLRRRDTRETSVTVGSVLGIEEPLISRLVAVAEHPRAVAQHRPALVLRHLAVRSVEGCLRVALERKAQRLCGGSRWMRHTQHTGAAVKE